MPGFILPVKKHLATRLHVPSIDVATTLLPPLIRFLLETAFFFSVTVAIACPIEVGYHSLVWPFNSRMVAADKNVSVSSSEENLYHATNNAPIQTPESSV